MTAGNRILTLIPLLLLLFSCMQNEQSIKDEFDSRLAIIQETYTPDQSLQLCQASLEKDQQGNWQLNGQTTVPNAKTAIINLADSLLGKDSYTDNSILLPHPQLGDSTYGIIKISVAHLRRDPGNSAELIDQAIMGNVIRLLRQERSWYLVQTHYGYIGYITRYSFERTDEKGMEDWKNGPLLRVAALTSRVYSKPDNQSVPVSDAVLNCAVRQVEKGRKWTEVRLPDGKTGYIASADVTPWSDDQKSARNQIQSILHTASSMMGVPYLWGGNSSKANDCSGFTQTVFRANGIQLPRDARQQVYEGTEIEPRADFSNVLPGDLLFFGIHERITHVGISLGGYDFIHQDSQVNIDSFDEQAENFNPFRKKTLKKIKRIL